MKFGVGITTRNRRELFLATIPHWLNHLPPQTPLVIVDDASQEPLLPIDGAHIIRHKERLGVGASKNDCIAYLTDAGCNHLFLADDDTWPKADNWWQPYIASPEHHLAYQWPKLTSQPSNKWRIIPQPDHPLDDTHFAIGFPRGVLLYLDRLCVETIGGMDPNYGRGEHVDFSYRCWLAGLTTFTQRDKFGATVAAYGDIRGSNELWHARDEHEHIESTFGDHATMRKLDREGGVNWSRNWVNNKPYRFDPWTGQRSATPIEPIK